MVEVKRRKGESFESFLRRFSRRIQMSGKILEAKKIRFHTREPNKNKRKESALRRLEMGKKRDYLMKIGRLVEDGRRRGPRRSAQRQPWSPSGVVLCGRSL